MCIMCLEFEQERMTKQEVWSAVGEMENTHDHTSDFIKHVFEIDAELERFLREHPWLSRLED